MADLVLLNLRLLLQQIKDRFGIYKLVDEIKIFDD